MHAIFVRVISVSKTNYSIVRKYIDHDSRSLIVQNIPTKMIEKERKV